MDSNKLLAESEEIQGPLNLKRCVWCTQIKQLLINKIFCAKCSLNGKECAYCHRPMADRFYTLSDRICNACFRKHEKLKALRRQRTVERRMVKKGVLAWRPGQGWFKYSDVTKTWDPYRAVI